MITNAIAFVAVVVAAAGASVTARTPGRRPIRPGAGAEQGVLTAGRERRRRLGEGHRLGGDPAHRHARAGRPGLAGPGLGGGPASGPTRLPARHAVLVLAHLADEGSHRRVHR